MHSEGTECSGKEEGGIALGASPTANRPPGFTCKTLGEVWFIPLGIPTSHPRSYCSAGSSTQGSSPASCWVRRKMAFQTSGPERLLQASRSGEIELARESHFNMLELSPTGDLAPGMLPKDLTWPIPSPFQFALAPLCFGSIPRKTRRGRAPLSGFPKYNVTEGWKNFGEPAGEAARLMTGARFISPPDWSATSAPIKTSTLQQKKGGKRGPGRP